MLKFPNLHEKRPVLLSVLYGRVKEACKDREICLSSHKSKKLNLSFKLYCCLETFRRSRAKSRAFMFLWGPADVTGDPQAQLAPRSILVPSWAGAAQIGRQSLKESQVSPAPRWGEEPFNRWSARARCPSGAAS